MIIPTATEAYQHTVVLVESSVDLCDLTLRIVSDSVLDEFKDNEKLIGRLAIDGRDYVVLAARRRQSRPTCGIGKLSNREIQIAHLVMSGACNKLIAQQLRISPYTVASYLKRIFCKLDCRTRAEMAALIADQCN